MSNHRHILKKHTSWTWWCFGLLDNVYECERCDKLFDLEYAEINEDGKLINPPKSSKEDK